MRKNNQRGFSLIEILMVLVLIAVLAAIAINAFINFRQEARDSALRANLQVMRNAIAAQYAQMQLRCGTDPGDFPDTDSINANNIADGNSTCTTGQVPIASERQFVQGGIPIPPIGTSATVENCAVGGGDCTRGNGTPCGAAFDEAWCYDEATGAFWIDSDEVDASAASYESY